MWPVQHLGHGVGLRRQHFTHLLEHGPGDDVDWFEIISENFFEPGGRPWAALDRVRRDKPIVVHGVSMALGNAEGVSRRYLERLRGLIDRIEPAWVSDHCCWGGYGGHTSHDLLPLPYTEETLDHLVRQVSVVQDVLQRRILVENVSSYVSFQASEMSEWEFLAQLLERADCGLLLDVNNIFVSANNHGFDPHDYLNGIPQGRVGQIHLAGHTDKGSFLLDTHVGPVPSGVFDLYRAAVRRFGRVPSLIEWDEDVPDYEVVVAEACRARALEAEVLRGAA